jgi:hypothetical protein
LLIRFNGGDLRHDLGRKPKARDRVALWKSLPPAKWRLETICRLPYSQNVLACRSSEGADVNSTLKIQKSEVTTLIERIKIELKKRADAKAKRMLLKRPKRLAKRCD